MRLLDIYMIRKASETFHQFGFENDILINRKHDKKISGGEEQDQILLENFYYDAKRKENHNRKRKGSKLFSNSLWGDELRVDNPPTSCRSQEDVIEEVYPAEEKKLSS